LDGLETMNGINLKAYYFLKNNIGFYLNLGFGNSSNSVFYQNPGEAFNQGTTDADFNSQSLGVSYRFCPDNSSARLIIGNSIGRYRYHYSYSQTANDNGQWYDGSYDILKFGIEALLEFRIVKGFHLFSEINYSTQLAVDADDFVIDYSSDSGDYYKIELNSPSMAAIRMSFGASYYF
jgi:hypothetical protein